MDAGRVPLGARVPERDVEGGTDVDRHRAGVEQETNDPEEAYAHVSHRQPTRYRDGWLPE